MLTGHCLVGRHTERLEASSNDLCQSCKTEEEEETVVHLICQCPALARTSMRDFGIPYLDSFSDLTVIKLNKIAHFIKASKL